MLKVIGAQILALNLVLVGCSDHSRESSKAPLSEKSSNLEFAVSISECRDMLLNDGEMKTAVELASNWNVEPKCEALVPKLVSAGYISLMDRGLSKIGILKYANSLQLLYLGSNEISNVTPLRDHSNLYLLDLQSNKVADISELGSMPRLKYLSLNENQLSSFEKIEKFPSMTNFLARNNRIESVLPLVNSMPNLEELAMTGNPLGSSIDKSEKNCPTGNLVPVGISIFCSDDRTTE